MRPAIAFCVFFLGCGQTTGEETPSKSKSSVKSATGKSSMKGKLGSTKSPDPKAPGDTNKKLPEVRMMQVPTIKNPLELDNPLGAWPASDIFALLPDEKTKKYALYDTRVSAMMMQTDIGIDKMPIAAFGHQHMAVVVDGLVSFWDLGRKKKSDDTLQLSPGTKSDLIFTQNQLVVSSTGEETLAVYGWPDLKKAEISGWENRKSIEALDIHNGLLLALDNILRRKYLISFEGDGNGGLKFHKSSELPVPPNAHFMHQALSSKYWVGHMSYHHRAASGADLYFNDVDALPDLKAVGVLRWKHPRDSVEERLYIRDMRFRADGKLLILSTRGVGLHNPEDGFQADAIKWTAVERGVALYPMEDGKAAVVSHADDTYSTHNWQLVTYE